MRQLFGTQEINTLVTEATSPVNQITSTSTTVTSEARKRLDDKIKDLSSQELAVLEATKKALVPGDFGSITSYSQGTSNITSSVVESVLKAANSTELDSLGGGVNKILITAKQIDAKSLTNAPHATWLKKLLPWLFVTKERVAAHFSSLGTQIDKYVEEIKAGLKTTDDSIRIMENMEKDCVQKYHMLEVSILAGGVRAEELRAEFEQKQAALKALPPDQVDPLQSQALQREWQFIDTLEKQVSAQQQHQQVVYMQLPQLAMMVKNAVDARSEFRQIIDLTIPLWKTSFAQALILEQQRKSNLIIKENKDFTNAMLKSNADNLKTSTLEIREQGARGLVDKETLEYIQTQFMQTMEGALAIHNKARESRAQLSQSIDKMRLDFKTSLQGY